MNVPADGAEGDALGIGLLYNSALRDFAREYGEAVDFFEIIPDLFWLDRGRGQDPRYEPFESLTDALDEIAPHWPVTFHSVGLSIGSAGIWDAAYLQQIARWQQRYGPLWYSEHLSCSRTGDRDLDAHSALALPVPYDAEVLEMLITRVQEVGKIVPGPFLLENSVYFTEMPEQEMSEPEFLNALCERSGCRLLLDLHNLYTNARNHRFEPRAFLDTLDLRYVREIHIAGGDEMDGMWLDSHAGAVAEPVWDLLNYVCPRAPHLRGIAFEFHESYFERLHPVGVLAQLARARESWAAPV